MTHEAEHDARRGDHKEAPDSHSHSHWRWMNGPSIITTIGFLIIAGMFVIMLNVQMEGLGADFDDSAIKTFQAEIFQSQAPDMSPMDLARVALEHDAQILRTKRAQSLIAARLFVQAIALLAGFALGILGCSLVLARIKDEQSSLASFKKNDQGEITMGSVFPGMIIAFFGVLTIAVTLITATHNPITTQDGAIYVRPLIYGAGGLGGFDGASDSAADITLGAPATAGVEAPLSDTDFEQQKQRIRRAKNGGD